MKKIFFSACLASLTLVAVAQDLETAKKNLKAAEKAFRSFKDAPDTNGADLLKAKETIDLATAGDFLSTDPKSYAKSLVRKGDIYRELVTITTTKEMLKADLTVDEDKYYDALYQAVSKNPAAGSLSADAYLKALAAPNIPKADKTEGLDGLQKTFSVLNNIGNVYNNKKEYKGAYEAFNKSATVLKYLKEQKLENEAISKSTPNDIFYNAAVSAYYGGMDAEAVTLLEDLKKDNYILENNPTIVYDLLTNSYQRTKNEAKMLATIQDARKKFPEDSNILVQEINYYLGKGEADKMEAQIKEGIAKDPKNKSLPLVLAQIYDQRQKLAYDKNNATEGDKYFAMAAETYSNALAADTKYFDAAYNLGALYFNRAATLNTKMNALGNTKADQKMYDELKAQKMVMFDKALPIFVNAESLATDKNDQRSIFIALKELYAQKGDLKKSQEYKARLDPK